MNLLARPSEWTRAGARPVSGTPFAGGPHLYFAFLSYSHRDAALAKWLQDQLEKFRVPHHLVGRITEHGAVPRRLTPIFRDIGELPASGDLGHEIKAALAASRFLVVLCSPAAANSKWTNAEVDAFKRVRPEGCVLAAIAQGEPFASDLPGREQEECFPRALRFKYDRRGRPTSKRAEPRAADLREPGAERRLGFLKLVAGMLGVGLDDLVRRDTVRRQQRLAALAAGSLAGMVAASALAVTAIQARDQARDQRREAESLVGFMLGDLRSKLEPVGRLDVLDGVGSRVLSYYQKQDMSDLSDTALLQRARALSLMGEIAHLRGDTQGALRLYRAALAGTGEALRRNPDDPQRLFDHAQNVFWIGEIEGDRGRTDRAMAAKLEYKRLADRMVQLDPDNMKWRMERHSAEANLGVAFLQQRRFAEAVRQFAQALTSIAALATADPGNGDYQKALAETLAWLADAQLALGNLDAAIGLRHRHIALLNDLLQRTGDVEYREKLIPAYRALGSVLGARAQFADALTHLRSAVAEADRLRSVEPANSKWTDYAARARLDLARQLLAAGQVADAHAQAAEGCRLTDALIARDSAVVDWRTARRDCLSLKSQIGLADGDTALALALAGDALKAAGAAKSADGVTDAYATARVKRLIGDIEQRRGDRIAAEAAWRSGLAALPSRGAEKPSEMAVRAELLQRIGRTAEARPLAARLKAIGYHSS
jgi:tetratricopeptide (TPR) repeat protein